MLNLAEIEAEVLHYASRIGAPGELLPTYGRSKDGGHPHIEVDSHSYHYVVVERGSELQRVTTADFETLLEGIFLDITSSLAFAYEGAHRIEEHDCRRMALPRQIELLALLRPEWAGHESRVTRRFYEGIPSTTYQASAPGFAKRLEMEVALQTRHGLTLAGAIRCQSEKIPATMRRR